MKISRLFILAMVFLVFTTFAYIIEGFGLVTTLTASVTGLYYGMWIVECKERDE